MVVACKSLLFWPKKSIRHIYIRSLLGPMIPLNSFINYSSQLVFVQDKWILLHSMSYWLLVHVQGIPLELFFYLVDLANWTNRIHHNFFICFKTYTSIMYVFKKKTCTCSDILMFINRKKFCLVIWVIYTHNRLGTVAGVCLLNTRQGFFHSNALYICIWYST